MVSHAEGLGGKLLDRARQMLCGLHGHDTLLQFEQDRMFLRCVSCGHETPGWELKDEPTIAVKEASERRRQPVMRPQLVNARRVA
jgi:hypothetical protein